MKSKYIFWYILGLLVLGLVIGIVRETHAPQVDDTVPSKAFHMPDVEFGPARPVRLPEAD